MNVNLRKLEKIQELLETTRRGDTSPLFFARSYSVDPDTALDDLVAAGTIEDGDRERVRFVVRWIVEPRAASD